MRATLSGIFFNNPSTAPVPAHQRPGSAHRPDRHSIQGQTRPLKLPASRFRRPALWTITVHTSVAACSVRVSVQPDQPLGSSIFASKSASPFFFRFTSVMTAEFLSSTGPRANAGASSGQAGKGIRDVRRAWRHSSARRLSPDCAPASQRKIHPPR